MSTSTAPVGSKSSDAPKIQSFNASVRRFHHTILDNLNRWVSWRCSDNLIFHFTHGVLVAVTFNGDAAKMKCGTMNSTADATGLLHIEPESLEDFLVGLNHSAHLGFNEAMKSFVVNGTEVVITSCDLLVLHDDGKATCYWRESPNITQS